MEGDGVHVGSVASQDEFRRGYSGEPVRITTLIEARRVGHDVRAVLQRLRQPRLQVDDLKLRIYL